MLFSNVKKDILKTIEAKIIENYQDSKSYGNLFETWSSLAGGSNTTDTYVFSILSGQQTSNWVQVERSYLTKLMTLLFPSDTPNTTVTFKSRPIDGGLETPIVEDKDIGSLLTLTVNGTGSFGSGALSRLASEVNREWQIELASSTTSNIDIELIIS